MPTKPDPNPPHAKKRLSLHPLSLEDALRAALKTPLPGKRARAAGRHHLRPVRGVGDSAPERLVAMICDPQILSITE